MLKTFGYGVTNLKTQKFSLSISCWVRVSLDLEAFVNWSIMVNFAYLLKLFKMFTSHYCVDFFHNFSMIIQFYIKACFCFFYIFFITWNALHQIYSVAVGNSLQQSDLKFVRHVNHLLGCGFCICLLLALFFSIFLLPINSLRFLFRLNVVTGWPLNISFRDSFISSKFQYFRITSGVHLEFWEWRGPNFREGETNIKRKRNEYQSYYDN